LYLEEKNDCYLDQRQAQELLQSSTNTNDMRSLYRVNEVLLQDFEDRINEELLADSLQDIHVDANNSIELPVDSNNDIDSDVNDENENLLVVNEESIVLDSNLFHGINGISSLEKLEDIKYYKEFLDCNSRRAKHTLYLVLEIINQNRKDNLLKIKMIFVISRFWRVTILIQLILFQILRLFLIQMEPILNCVMNYLISYEYLFLIVA